MTLTHGKKINKKPILIPIAIGIFEGMNFHVLLPFPLGRGWGMGYKILIYD